MRVVLRQKYGEPEGGPDRGALKTGTEEEREDKSWRRVGRAYLESRREPSWEVKAFDSANHSACDVWKRRVNGVSIFEPLDLRVGSPARDERKDEMNKAHLLDSDAVVARA